MITETFNYTGSVQEWTVPPEVFYVKIRVWGAGGGDAVGDTTRNGRNGGYSSGYISTTPGEKLYLYVGGRGEDGTNASGGAGGWPYGGNGGYTDQGQGCGGGGGGASTEIRRGSTSRGNIIIAAGGGGGGWGYYNHSIDYDASPTSGGGLEAHSSPARANSDGERVYEVPGGTQACGGSSPQGGNGESDYYRVYDDGNYGASGGGGGGYCGGGGGEIDCGYSDGGNNRVAVNGGAGGSGYIDGVLDGYTNGGNGNGGDGQIRLEYVPASTIGGDYFDDATIDGESVTSITIDGTTVWQNYNAA